METIGSLNLWQWFTYGGTCMVLFGGVLTGMGTYLKDKHQSEQSAKIQADASEKQKHLEEMLKPILDLAMQKFPGLTQEDALNKFREELRKLQKKTEHIEKSIAPRVLTEQQCIQLAGILKAIPNLKLELMSTGEAEPKRLMLAFMNIVSRISLAHLSVSENVGSAFGQIEGVVLYVKTPELENSLRPFKKQLDQYGLQSKIQVIEKLPADTLYLIFGPK